MPIRASSMAPRTRSAAVPSSSMPACSQRGMLRIAEAPEHVLEPVWGVEQDKEKSFAETVELGIHHFFALVEHQTTIGKIIQFVKTVVVVAIVVFCHAKSSEEPYIFRQLLC